jgi:hypothetical protein
MKQLTKQEEAQLLFDAAVWRYESDAKDSMAYVQYEEGGRNGQHSVLTCTFEIVHNLFIQDYERSFEGRKVISFTSKTMAEINNTLCPEGYTPRPQNVPDWFREMREREIV